MVQQRLPAKALFGKRAHRSLLNPDRCGASCGYSYSCLLQGQQELQYLLHLVLQSAACGVDNQVVLQRVAAIGGPLVAVSVPSAAAAADMSEWAAIDTHERANCQQQHVPLKQLLQVLPGLWLVCLRDLLLCCPQLQLLSPGCSIAGNALDNSEHNSVLRVGSSTQARGSHTTRQPA